MRITKFILLLLVVIWNPARAETLKEYADKCTQEIGIDVPDFKCAEGTPAKGEGENYGGVNVCNFPNRLNRACDPGSVIKILANDDNVAIVASCRKDGESTAATDSFYNDIAIIQQNKKNGATCFYQALGHNDGSLVPSPNKEPNPNLNFKWLPPEDLSGGNSVARINCVSCHDNGAFIRSPYMANLKNIAEPDNIGGGKVTLNRSTDAYWFPGVSIQNHQWRTYSVAVQGNSCLTCHRLSVGTTDGSRNSGTVELEGVGTASHEVHPPFHRSSAMDFSLIATAGSEINKSPHGSDSPIWMPPNHNAFNQASADAAKQVSDCAKKFDPSNLSNPATNLDTCRITPHVKPILRIVYPNIDHTEHAGDRSDPGKIWLHVDPPAAALPDVSSYTVKIAGVTAKIISGAKVGNEFWMVIQPVANNTAVPTAGLYDMEVSVTVPNSTAQSDLAAKSVYLGDPGVPVDLAIVGDISGSMAANGKLQAAQNAARLYVDHASSGDKLAVVSFASTANADLHLTDVTDATLTSARNKINTWIASGQTALGEGLLTAVTELSATSGHQKRMALLSDGNENVAPFWRDGPTGSVQNAVLTQKSILDMVTLGDDAAVLLAQDIAAQTDGRYFRIDPSASVSLATLLPAPNNTSLASTPTTTPRFIATAQTTAGTTSLPNILADVFKSMAEVARKEQRIGDWNGQLSFTSEKDSYELNLESGLPEVLFAVNWNLGSEKLILKLNGAFCTNVPGSQKITDSTHFQCRVNKPAPGKWVITVQEFEEEPPEVPVITQAPTQAKNDAQFLPVVAPNTIVNYKLMVSAYSQIVMMPFVRDIPLAPGDKLPVIAFVGDNMPITNATVFINILAPNGTKTTLQLFDDGAHGDGKSGDGFYGNTITVASAGPYSIDFTTAGNATNGIVFKRKLRNTVRVKPGIFLPLGLMARDSLIISDNSKITSLKREIYAGNSLELGAGTAAEGNISVNGSAFLRSNSLLKGNLTYSTSLQRQNGASITGIIKQQVPALIPTFETFSTPYGTADITLENDKSTTWSAGDYRDGIVRARSSLRLHAGIYHFRSLVIEPNTKVQAIGGKEGDVQIFVDGKVQIGANVKIGGDCIRCFMVYTNSAESIYLAPDVTLTGSVVAPNGEVDIHSRSGTFVNIAAKRIRIEPNAKLIFD